MFIIDEFLQGSRGEEVVVDVFDAGFIEGGVGFAEGDGVLEEKWLGRFADGKGKRSR